MRIEEDIKLDYNNVLIRPKRSTLGSRKEVDLERGFKFRNYQGETIDDYRHYRGVPIMASNMDGVGTFDMADTLAKQKIFTCLVKTLQVDELVNYFNADHDFRREHVAMSIGITDNDSEKFKEVYNQVDKDGGCATPGDVVKAFAGGADFVMLGGMLAGHDEGGGKVVTKEYLTKEVGVTEEKSFIQFYGMSSDAANVKHFGGLKDYRSSEGREVLVPYRGEVSNTIQDILGGIRSSCTYAGAQRLKHLMRCATFIRCYDTHNRVYENN